ncbi:MAG: HAMP domain-containing histidine kinase [Candidatus Riflebacteria bacterium]|nr:HAMP domain-containing histidine kinase [Candidatus Riflebacteria bacterium]
MSSFRKSNVSWFNIFMLVVSSAALVYFLTVGIVAVTGLEFSEFLADDFHMSVISEIPYRLSIGAGKLAQKECDRSWEEMSLGTFSSRWSTRADLIAAVWAVDFSRGEYKLITASGTVSAKIASGSSLQEALQFALDNKCEATLPADYSFFLREQTFIPLEYGSVTLGSETFILSAQEKIGGAGVFRRGVILKRSAFLEKVKTLNVFHNSTLMLAKVTDSKGKKVLSMGKFSEDPAMPEARLASETSRHSEKLSQSLMGMELVIYHLPFGKRIVGRWSYLNFATLLSVTLVLAFSLSYFYYKTNVHKEELTLQNDWIGNLAHTLRGPVHSVGILMEALGKVPDTGRERLLGLARREIDSLDAVCRHFIQASRAGKNQIQLSMTEVNLQTAINAILERLLIRFPQFTPASISLQSLDQIKVKADPDALSEILYNMLENAMKFSPRGGTLTIQARKTNGRIILEVVDRGIGFPAELKEHIGTPFFRGAVEGTDGIVGTGLGIYLTRKICDQMDASFEISSEGLGKGASAVLTLREAL